MPGRVRKTFGNFGVDISRLKFKEGSGTEEFVVTDSESRTVFGNYASFHDGPRQWNVPNEADVSRADFISIDPYFREESLQAARLSAGLGKPYVSNDCRYDDFISINAAAMIVTYELWDREYKGMDLEKLFGKYLESCKGLIIFTFGSKDLWYARPGLPFRKFKPFNIKPVDTAGAGDSFRAGIIYGLLNLWDDARTVEFASAVAACALHDHPAFP